MPKHNPPESQLWCYLCKTWGDHVAARCPTPNRAERLSKVRAESAEFWQRIRDAYREDK